MTVSASRNKLHGFRQPGEWSSHRSCWVAFPSDPELWPDLDAVQASFVAMCRGIALPEGQERPAEGLDVLVQDAAAETRARALLAGLGARFHHVEFGDIWMRDVAPVFLTGPGGEVSSVRFRFNGWGEKYVYPGDSDVAAQVQLLGPHRRLENQLVLEGGGVESDGAGLCMTTREVLLNPNRNPGLTEADVEVQLRQALGAERVIWLDRGLLNDHTDGHIDNIARFIGVNRVVCSHPADDKDPNFDVLKAVEADLRAQGLEVETIVSPGEVLGRDGRVLPASYLNFYIANQSVVVPVFGSVHDEAALEAIGKLFPGRVVQSVQAKVFLEEGGTVHCITQQEPLPLKRTS